MRQTKAKEKLQECDGDLCGSLGICYARDPKDVYVCTRSVGHSGNHVACSGENHNLSVWKNGKERSRKEQEVAFED